MKSDISLILLSDSEDIKTEISDALGYHFPNFYNLDMNDATYHQIMVHKHTKIIFIYACLKIESSKNLCEQIHNDPKLVEIFNFPNIDFLLCPVAQTKAAYDACMESHFQDYSTMRPIYDKWNLVLRFIHLVDTDSVIRSKTELEKRYGQLKAKAKNLILTIKNRPMNLESISVKINSAIDKTSENISNEVVKIPSAIQNNSIKEHINVNDQEKVSVFFKEQAQSISKSSITPFTELNDSITELAKIDNQDISENTPTTSNTRKSILLVDDEPFMAQVIKPIMDKHDFEFNYIEKGVTLIDGSIDFKVLPDIIFLDIDMPELNGLQILKEIKHNGLFQGVPIVMLTGFSDKRVVRKASQLGSDGYLVKPVKSDILLQTIDTLIT